MRPESDHFSATDDYPHPEWWKARDAGASEVEVGDFLYGLVRLVQPEVVLETGTYLGDTTFSIAEALSDNEHGILYTCDTNESYVLAAEHKFKYLPVKVLKCDGIELTRQHPDAQLAFIDSGGDRLAEIANLRNAWVVLHDARWYGKVDGMFFPTPRGLALMKVANGKAQ